MPLLPDNLQYHIDDILVHLSAHREDAPTPSQRRNIYTSIGAWDDPSSTRIRARVAIAAAERALYIYESVFPQDTFPRSLIAGAHHALHTDRRIKNLDDLLEQGYNASGHCWGYDEEELPFPIDYAGQAAYHALCGATHGCYFLQDLHTGYGVVIGEQTHIIHGDEWTNMRLLDFANAVDTALFAAVALSCDQSTDDIRPIHWSDIQRMRWDDYWQWWLLECIPTAWNAEYTER